MKVALAQINSVVGDVVGNSEKIIACVKKAFEQKAQIVVTPELSLVGYPPEDLLLREAFYVRAEQSLLVLADALRVFPDIYVLVGHPIIKNGKFFNAASVLVNGKILGTYCKSALPNHAVFDEVRYFDNADEPFVFKVNDVCFGVNICEDAWNQNAPLRSKEAGAQILLVLNASPYHINKQTTRLEMLRQHVSGIGLSLVYVNSVGGQDELVFDGNSFVLDAQGEICVQLKHCQEDLVCVELENIQVLKEFCAPIQNVEQQIYQALVLGVQDYILKNKFSQVLIGLSGGIDSALVLAIAVDALGADKVRAVMMPSRYTADISWLDAREMVKRLGVRYDEISIHACVEAFDASLSSQFVGLPLDATEENIQARIRGTILMALSNKTGALVLTTGNKSEMAVGYCTLYGDMAGAFAVIKDVAKTLVYRLCAYRNSLSSVIPERILTRAPSAELREDQTDQDSLPAYEVLDSIMQLYVEKNKSIVEIIQEGFHEDDVKKVVRLIKINEYKRRQAPVGIRITERAFGRDWRYPITSSFLE
jgi:NAD+ synthase (glutamine-hydrolysing)